MLTRHEEEKGRSAVLGGGHSKRSIRKVGERKEYPAVAKGQSRTPRDLSSKNNTFRGITRGI